jgi:PhnB protein
MAVKPIPDGYHTATPYLIVNSAARALDFYKEAFEATEIFRLTGPNGQVVHAEIKIGDSPIMLADEMPDSEFHSPKSGVGSSVSIMLYVDNVDVRFTKATRAGAKTLRGVENQFYGDRAGTLQDPFGHIWTIATHKEDVPPEEINKRAAAMFKQQSAS